MDTLIPELVGAALTILVMFFVGPALLIFAWIVFVDTYRALLLRRHRRLIVARTRRN
jgi:hypothetical protein